MACTRALEVDVADFLADPGAEAWGAFRDHYPRCHDCAVQVRTWTELTAALARDAHPDPETLVRFVDGATTLPASTREGVASHLQRCAACRDEARTLGTFDLAAALRDAPARRHQPHPSRRRPSRLRILWHPAFAYAAALLAVVYPFLSGRIQAPEVERAVRQVRSRSDAPAPPAATPPASLEKDLRDEAFAESSTKPAKNEAKEAPPPRRPEEAAKRRIVGPRAKAAPQPSAPPVIADGEQHRGGVAALGATRSAESTPTTIVLTPGGEHTVTLADDGSDVSFVVAGRRLRNLRRAAPDGDGGAVIEDPVAVSSRWLAPGPYIVDAIATDGSVTRIRFRIARP